SGGIYEWLPDQGPGEIDPAEAPDWMVQRMAAAAAGKARSPFQVRPGVAPVGTQIPEGQRDATLTSLAGSMRRRGMSEEAIAAALLAVKAQQCKPPLPDELVRKIARSVARYAPGQTGQPTTAGDVEQLDGIGIILKYLRETLQPRFKRKKEVFSEAQGYA